MICTPDNFGHVYRYHAMMIKNEECQRFNRHTTSQYEGYAISEASGSEVHLDVTPTHHHLGPLDHKSNDACSGTLPLSSKRVVLLRMLELLVAHLTLHHVEIMRTIKGAVLKMKTSLKRNLRLSLQQPIQNRKQ